MNVWLKPPLQLRRVVQHLVIPSVNLWRCPYPVLKNTFLTYTIRFHWLSQNKHIYYLTCLISIMLLYLLNINILSMLPLSRQNLERAVKR